MKIGSLVKTKKFILSFFLNTLILTLIGFSFSRPVNKSYYSYETWNNCTSKYVAYDSRKFDKNYYYYFGDRVSVALNNGDGVLIKADVYQFIDGVTYDDGSLLNEKNVVDGFYSTLDDNEIAISDTVANKYGLKIGDALYVNDSLKPKVKYVFRNLYDIKEPSIDNDGNVVFVGFNSPILEKFIYAGFSNETTVFNEAYPFSKPKTKFLEIMFIYLGMTCVLALAAELALILVYRKQEKANLYEDLISGSKADYCQSLIVVNLLLHMLPALMASAVLASIRHFLSALTVVSVVLIVSLIKCIVLRLRVH